MGILSPCSPSWGEISLLPQNSPLKFFWYIQSNVLMFRRELIDLIFDFRSDSPFHFLYDPLNFRGYCAESELIAKCYINNFAAGITSAALASEDESYLLQQHELIMTEPYDDNLQLYLSEGLEWMRVKYGFTSRWDFNQYVKVFYDLFFKITLHFSFQCLALITSTDHIRPSNTSEIVDT